MIKEIIEVPDTIKKATAIECDICKITYKDENELRNMYHFYKDYDWTSIFMEDVRGSTQEYIPDDIDIEFDICQHCVKDLLDHKLVHDVALKKENEDLQDKLFEVQKESASLKAAVLQIISISENFKKNLIAS